MFNKKTLFIVGAGASKEVGLPTGTELMETIADKLDIRSNRTSGQQEIIDTLQSHANRNGIPLKDLLSEAQKVSNSMATALSIDNLIHTHSTNQNLVLCAKLGIAQSILETER